MAPSHARPQRIPARGFTLVELVAVILIVGVLGAAAAGRMMERNQFDDRAFADQAAALVRFGQKVAIAQNRNVYVRISPASVALCYAANCPSGSLVTGPAGGNSGSTETAAACGSATWACEAPPQGVKINTTSQFYFDALGKPFAVGDPVTGSVSSIVAPLAVSIGTRSFVVEAETGYVH